jgi:hypothetical protein
MRPCCPPGEGCNSPTAGEACALTELRRDPRPEARRALRLWEHYQDAAGSRRARRFLRRAYGRARDRALGLWTPWRSSGFGRSAG